MVPLLGAIVLIYGLAAEPATVIKHANALTAVLPGDVADLVGEQLVSVVKTSDGKKGLGLLLALAIAWWGARNAAGSIIGAELNSEIEHQTARDSTEGAPAPLGARGARSADHVAGQPDETSDTSHGEATPLVGCIKNAADARPVEADGLVGPYEVLDHSHSANVRADKSARKSSGTILLFTAAAVGLAFFHLLRGPERDFRKNR